MQLIGILFIRALLHRFFAGDVLEASLATAGFFGMMAGTLGCLVEYLLYRFGMIHFRTPMASNVWMAVWGFVAGLSVMVTYHLCHEGA